MVKQDEAKDVHSASWQKVLDVEHNDDGSEAPGGRKNKKRTKAKKRQYVQLQLL